MTGYLLDTNALIWLGTGQPVQAEAEAALNRAAGEATPVSVSPYCAWEIGILVSRGRIRLPSDPHAWFASVLRTGNLRLTPLTPEILIASSFLPAEPPRDPADRVMIATARTLDLTLVTRDRAILAYAAEGHLRALPC